MFHLIYYWRYMELLSQEYNEKIAKTGVFLTAKNERVSTAESCTGGLIASAFTQFPGASAWYFGSIVAYDNTIKQKILGVPSDVLQKYGAASEQTVEKMLEGANELFKTEWVLAVSGIAGPSGATFDKPIGTVYVGVLYKGKVLEISHNKFSGNRSQVRLQTVQKAIDSVFSRL